MLLGIKCPRQGHESDSVEKMNCQLENLVKEYHPSVEKVLRTNL